MNLKPTLKSFLLLLGEKAGMRASLLTFASSFILLPSAFAQTNQPTAVALSVMVNSNGVVIAPANFAAANGFGTNSGGGLSTNLAPAKIYIGNALSNATAQAVSGDLTLSTNGAATLTATGAAGTYAQATFDGKGRETSGATVLPINAGGTGQTAASAALAALGGASLTASNNITGGQNFTGGIRLGTIYSASGGQNGVLILFDPMTNTSGDQALILSGSPWTSGASLAGQMKMTNVMGSADGNGYYTWDPLALQMMPVGLQAAYGNLPGVDLLVANNEPIVIAGSSGLGNKGLAWFTSDSVNGNQTLFPHTGSSTNNRAAIISYKVVNVGVTNTVTFPSDQDLTMRVNEDTGAVTIYQAGGGGLILANGVTLSTTNGIILKANGKLANSASFDSSDVGAVHHDVARVWASNYVALVRGSFTGGGNIGYDASGAGDGMSYYQTPNGGGAFVLMLGCGDLPQLGLAQAGQSWHSTACVAVGGSELDDFRTWGNGVFDVHGSIAPAINTYTSSMTAAQIDSTILLNGTTNICTLPDATSHCKGREYTIKEIANSTGQVWTSVAAQKIEGGTNYTLTAQYKYMTVQSDGTQWWIIANN